MVIKNTGFPIAFSPEFGKIAGAERAGSAQPGAKAASAGRTDRIEFSSRPEKRGDFAGDLKTRLHDEMEADADAGRLQKLRESIAEGRYAADPQKLAGILLFDEQG